MSNEQAAGYVLFVIKANIGHPFIFNGNGKEGAGVSSQCFEDMKSQESKPP